MGIKMILFNEESGKTILSLLTPKDIDAVVDNLYEFYDNCMVGYTTDDDKMYMENYGEMRGMYSTLLYLNKRCPEEGKMDVEEIAAEVGINQDSKFSWTKWDFTK